MQKLNKNQMLGIGVLIVVVIVLVALVTMGPIGHQPADQLTEKQQSIVAILDSTLCDFDSTPEKQAMDNKDATSCYCIEEGERRDMCVVTVTNATYRWRAVETLDISYCDNISIESEKEACRVIVQDYVDYMVVENPNQLATTKAANAEFEEAARILESIPGENMNISDYMALALMYAEWGLAENKEEEYIPKAFENLEKAKSFDTENPEVYRIEGYLYEVDGDIVSSINSYNIAIQKDASYIMAYVGRGHAHQLIGMLEKALEDFEKAKELDAGKEYIRIYANLCRLQSSRDDLIEDAIENCNIALKIGSSESALKAEVLIILSDIYLSTKQYLEAGGALESAKAQNPKDPNVYVSFANLYNTTEYYGLAEENARTAIGMDSKKTAAYAYLAFALMKQGRFNEAIEEANKGLEVIEADLSLLTDSKPFFEQYLYYVISDTYSNMGDSSNAAKYAELGDNV